MTSDVSLWDSLNQRQLLRLLKDVIFTYFVIDTGYQFGSALYHRGLLVTLSDFQKWIKLVHLISLVLNSFRRGCFKP